VNLNAAPGLEIVGEENVDVALVPGEQQLLPDAVQGNATFSGVARVDVVVALGIVELLDVGIDDAISLHRFAIVDGRLIDLEPESRLCRDIFKQIFGKAAPDGLGDKVHDEAVAVRELKVSIHPGLRASR
jgi:hypothetical protein